MPPKKKNIDNKKDDPADALTRIAIISGERCKPKKCNHECEKGCPVVMMGKVSAKLCFLYLSHTAIVNGILTTTTNIIPLSCALRLTRRARLRSFRSLCALVAVSA